MNTKAVNLWYNPSKSVSPAIFSYPGESLLNYRDVDVYKNPAGSWDYVLNGATITQRAGFERGGAIMLIDDLLAGNTANWCSDKVRAHIKSSLYPTETDKMKRTHEEILKSILVNLEMALKVTKGRADNWATTGAFEYGRESAFQEAITLIKTEAGLLP